MATSVAEVVMLLGDKVIELHEKDKVIRQLNQMIEELKAENSQLRQDLGQFQKAQAVQNPEARIPNLLGLVSKVSRIIFKKFS